MNDSAFRTLPWRNRPLAELVRLAWPIAVSQLSFTLMTAVDTLFVGHLGPAALAGVALGGTGTFTLLCFGIGLLRATKILVAQAVGGNRSAASHAYLGAGLVAALGLGFVIALLGQVLAALLPRITAGVDSGRLAATYASVRLLGSPILLVAITLREARQATGDARTPMIATLIANVVNAGLVALFLLVFKLGIAGVAWATNIAQLVEACVLMQQQRARGFGLDVWTLADLRTVLRLGIPLGIERFFDVASFSLVVLLFARMGDVDLAAHQVTNQVVLFAFMPCMAIGEAACVLIGQAVGAASLRTVPRVQLAALAAAFIYVAACSCALLWFAAPMAQLFTHDVAVIVRAAQLCHVAAGLVWLLPLYQIGQSTLRGIGDVRAAAWITVGAAWGCTPLLAAFFGITLGMGAVGGWIGLCIEIALASTLFWWRLRGRGGAWLRHARRFRATLRLDARGIAVVP
jgi:MATE family multidrug resistance protein